MKKNNLRNKLQSGFLEAAPDVYEAVLKAAEKDEPSVQEESWKMNASDNRILEEEDVCKQERSNQERVIRGRFTKYALSACAGFAIFFICLFGMLGKNQDNIYVVMDINPSIKIVMNASYQVKKLQGLNPDGKKVVEELEQDRGDSLLETVGVLFEHISEESYLHEGSGILVTISTSDRNVYQDLEVKLGSKIDEKLEEIGIKGVTTAFQCTDGKSAETGREMLERELAEAYGADREELRQMSVMELIQYCQKRTSMKLNFSPLSEKQMQDDSEKSKEKDTEDQQRKKSSSPAKIKEDNKEQPGKKENKEKSGDKKPKKQESDNKESKDTDKPPQENGQSSSDGNTVNPKQDVPPPDNSLPQAEGGPEVEPQDKDNNSNEDDSNIDNNNKDNSNKNNNNKNNSNKDNNNKDNNNKNNNKNNSNKNNNKDNSNKDNNNKDNSNKDNNNKDNGNKDNNKDNGNKDNNNKDNGNKDDNNKDNSNKDNNNKDNGGKDNNKKDN